MNLMNSILSRSTDCAADLTIGFLQRPAISDIVLVYYAPQFNCIVLCVVAHSYSAYLYHAYAVLSVCSCVLAEEILAWNVNALLFKEMFCGVLRWIIAIHSCHAKTMGSCGSYTPLLAAPISCVAWSNDFVAPMMRPIKILLLVVRSIFSVVPPLYIFKIHIYCKTKYVFKIQIHFDITLLKIWIYFASAHFSKSEQS
jgi:hypothetical protein